MLGAILDKKSGRKLLGEDVISEISAPRPDCHAPAPVWGTACAVWWVQGSVLHCSSTPEPQSRALGELCLTHMASCAAVGKLEAKKVSPPPPSPPPPSPPPPKASSCAPAGCKA